VVGDLAGINKWVPMASHARVEGMKRTCALADGSGELREDIIDYSNEKRSYRYTIADGTLPVKNNRGGFAVKTDGRGSLVVWDTEFDVLDAGQEVEVGRMSDGIYKQFLESLKQLIEKA
jgi:hypothetical protein